MKKVSGLQVVTTGEASGLPLPGEIQEALGELVGAAREGLLALSVGVGLRVVHELMEAEVTEVVGPKGLGHGRALPGCGPEEITSDRHAKLPVKSRSC